MDEERATAGQGPTPHERHIAAGYCPAISHTKAWCGRLAPHLGRHGSPRVPTPGVPLGPDNPNWVEWDD